METDTTNYRTVRLLMPVKRRFDRFLIVEKQYKKRNVTANEFINDLLELWEKENVEKAEIANVLKVGS